MPETPENGEELLYLWTTLALARDSVYRATQDELRRYNVAPVRGAVTFLIHSLGNKATPGAIGKGMLRKRNSINDLLIRMEKADLVKRLPVEPYKKLKRYELTEKGEQLYRKTTQLRTVEYIFSSLTPKQRKQLETLLRKVTKKAFEMFKESDKLKNMDFD